MNRVTHLRSPQPKFNCGLVNPVPPCNTVFVVVVVVVVLFFFSSASIRLLIRGTQRLFSVNDLFGEANVA